MKFMMMVKADKDYEAGIPPSPTLMAAIGQLTEEMTKAGVVLDTGGLLPSAQGARLHLAKSKVTVLDGPFAEAKEQMAGFDVNECANLDEAIEVASKHPVTRFGAIEVRPFWEE